MAQRRAGRAGASTQDSPAPSDPIAPQAACTAQTCGPVQAAVGLSPGPWSWHADKQHIFDIVRFVSFGFPIGLAFGIGLEKSKVYLPIVIMGQLSMSSFLMLKVFLTASALSTVVLTVGHVTGLSAFPETAARKLGFGVLFGYGGTLVGGLLIGVGMALTGACPGTVFAQLGAGVPGAPVVVAGALFGAFLFGLVYERTRTTNPAFYAETKHPRNKLDTTLGRELTGLLVAAMLASIAIAIDVFFVSWTDEAKTLFVAHFPGFQVPAGNSFLSPVALDAQMWSPFTGALAIGLLQIPAVLLVGSTLGTSSSYVTAIGLAVRNLPGVPKALRENSYFARFVSVQSLWQTALVVGVVTGARWSARSSGFDPASASAVALSTAALPWWRLFFGAAIMLFGARMAGGCTSGHGLSGIAKLSLASFVAVAAMFGGGILTSTLVLPMLGMDHLAA